MKNFLTIICIGFVIGIYAQQDPQYTQYTYNQSIINPAYATDNLGVINLGAQHRSQWVNSVGAPRTFNFFAHAPVGKSIELGLSIVTDDIGDGVAKENNFYADFAYVLKIADGHKLSLGLKAGFTSLTTDFNGFRFPDENVTTGFVPNDFAFNNINTTVPNFGTGAFYFTDKYYLGIATPNLIRSEHLVEQNGINSIGGEELHLFINGGYVFQLSDAVKLKPSFITRLVRGAPFVADVSVNALFNNKIEGGLSYRLNDAVSATFNIRVLETLRVGYAYDYTTSELNNFNSGSHEVLLLFDFDTLSLNKGYDKSPRFF